MRAVRAARNAVSHTSTCGREVSRADSASLRCVRAAATRLRARVSRSRAEVSACSASERARAAWARCRSSWSSSAGVTAVALSRQCVLVGGVEGATAGLTPASASNPESCTTSTSRPAESGGVAVSEIASSMRESGSAAGRISDSAASARARVVASASAWRCAELAFGTRPGRPFECVDLCGAQGSAGFQQPVVLWPCAPEQLIDGPGNRRRFFESADAIALAARQRLGQPVSRRGEVSERQPVQLVDGLLPGRSRRLAIRDG